LCSRRGGGGCGTKAVHLQADQTVQLKGDTPALLVVEPQPKDYDMTIEIAADQPVDVSLIVNRTEEEAVKLAKKHQQETYGKANAKSHKIECTVAANVRTVLVVWQDQTSGTATVQVRRTK
jgi:hypothetical protein